MEAIREALKGKKTYIQAGAAGLVIALTMIGTIDEEMALQVLGLLGAGSVASIAAKIDRNTGAQ